MLVTQCPILPSSFGKWYLHPNGFSNSIDDVLDLSDFKNECDYDLYLLGADDLPSGLEDIRDNTENGNQCDMVYGYLIDSEPFYVGLREWE